MVVQGDADLAVLGSVLADRARCRILLALADGRALPASVLASEAGVAASTASTHLGRLIDSGLVTVEARGRYRYYSLAGPQVGALIETLSQLAPAEPVRSLRQGTRAHALRQGRTCYDHLAGRLGVAITDRLVALGAVAAAPLGPHPVPARNETVYHVESPALFDDLDIEVEAGSAIPCCVDWTERRHHLSGQLGRDLVARFRERQWIRPSPFGRAVSLTEGGAKGLAGWIGFDPSAVHQG